MVETTVATSELQTTQFETTTAETTCVETTQESPKYANGSFYQKLSEGHDVNVLIVGDSIGAGAGTKTYGKQWYLQLQAYLKNKYGSQIYTNNVSMGGNTSYAGYVRTMSLNDGVNYDMAIICYGQNDSIDGFAINYEAMIKAIRTKYPDCSIISILESSQREYTEKMKTIQNICNHYGIPIADTIASFANSGKGYNILSDDKIHPNDNGQDIYFDTVKNVIDVNVIALTEKMNSVSSINDDVHKYDNFLWIDSDTDFERLDDTTFYYTGSAFGILGIDYTYVTGDNKVDIYVDDQLFKAPVVTFNYDFSQRHILIVSEECAMNTGIKVVFKDKNQADGFKGMCFSWR